MTALSMKHSEGWQDLNFKVDPELHRALKIIAAQRGVSMKALFEESIECWSEIKGDDATDAYLPPKLRAKNRRAPPGSHDFLDWLI
jgi:predicted HicB family RNase H-like nuclease